MLSMFTASSCIFFYSMGFPGLVGTVGQNIILSTCRHISEPVSFHLIPRSSFLISHALCLKEAITAEHHCSSQ